MATIARIFFNMSRLLKVNRTNTRKHRRKSSIQPATQRS
jgi:hypothetical protein